MNSSVATNIDHNRSVTSIFSELNGEIQQFVRTRADIFKAEIREKLPHLRNAGRLGLIGALFLMTGYLFLAIAVVSLVAAAFPNSPYRWFLGFLIVGVLSAILGTIAAVLAKSEFNLKSLVPERTIEVLKHDKTWVSNEAHQI